MEVVGGFLNAVILIIMSLGMLLESVERFFMPPEEIHAQKLLWVAVLGLLINLIGLFAFDSHSHGHQHEHHGHHHDHHEHKDHHCHEHDHSHSSLWHGMFLHILADTLGSVGVIISSLLIEYYDFIWADSVCSFLIALLLLHSSLPLFQSSLSVLMDAVPPASQSIWTLFLNQLQNRQLLQGVHQILEAHLWQITNGKLCIMLKLKVDRDLDQEQLKAELREVLRKRFPELKYVNLELEKDVV